MTFNEYQEKAFETGLDISKQDLFYPALGLAGESGEVVDKIKKFYRDGKLDKTAVGLELGDVLWYLSMLAKHMGYTLEQIAEMNITKLLDRKARNVLHGEGDNR